MASRISWRGWTRWLPTTLPFAMLYKLVNLCARIVITGTIKCWRVDNISELPSGSDQFSSISSGSGFSGGISKATLRVRCWGKATA
ncbi:hypothetical protein EV2_000148 [Malus domestica]